MAISPGGNGRGVQWHWNGAALVAAFPQNWTQKKNNDAQTLTIYLTELHPSGAGYEFLDRYPMTFCRTKAIFYNKE